MNSTETALAWCIWVVGAGAVLLVLGSTVLPRVSVRWSRRIERMALRSPRALYLFRQASLYFAIVGLAILVLYNPGWPPWAIVTGDEFADQSGVARLLAPAAALLALMLFAVTQMRGLEKDSAQGEKHLNQNVSTYLALRSWSIRIFDVPLFAIALLLLFLIPLVIDAAPAAAEWPGWVPWSEFSARQIGLACWCACFGVVGAVLLLNAMNALRLSTEAALYPGWVRRRIEGGLRRESAMAFEAILTDSERDRRVDAERWTESHLTVAGALPVEEQRPYLEATVSRSARMYVERRWVHLAQRRAQRGEGHRSRIPGAGQGILSDLGAGAREYALDLFRRALVDLQDARLGVSRAMLRHLAEPATSPLVVSWLRSECLSMAVAADADARRLGSDSADIAEARQPPTSGSIASSALTGNADDIHRIGDVVVFMGRVHEPVGPRVVRISASIFMEMTELVFDQRRSKLEPGEVSELIVASSAICDLKTRAFIEETIASDAVRFLSGPSVEDVVESADILRSAIRRTSGGRPRSRPAGDVSPDLRSQFESAAIGRIATGGDETGEVTAQLLTFVDGRRVPAVLLHLLFHGRRSSGRSTAAPVTAFYEALASIRRADASELGEVVAETTRFLLRSTYVRHFVHPELVEWLFDARDRRLCIDLCADFLRQMDRPGFADFSLTDFVNWHIAVASYRARFGFDDASGSDHDRALVLDSAVDLIETAEAWNMVVSDAAEQLVYELRIGTPEPTRTLIDSSGFV